MITLTKLGIEFGLLIFVYLLLSIGISIFFFVKGYEAIKTRKYNSRMGEFKGIGAVLGGVLCLILGSYMLLLLFDTLFKLLR